MTPSFSRSRSPSHIHLALALHRTEDSRRHPAPSSALPLSRLCSILIVSLFTLVHFAFPLTSSSHAIPSPHRSPISAHFYYLHSSAPHPSLRMAVQLPLLSRPCYPAHPCLLFGAFPSSGISSHFTHDSLHPWQGRATHISCPPCLATKHYSHPLQHVTRVTYMRRPA